MTARYDTFPITCSSCLHWGHDRPHPPGTILGPGICSAIRVVCAEGECQAVTRTAGVRPYISCASTHARSTVLITPPGFTCPMYRELEGGGAL